MKAICEGQAVYAFQVQGSLHAVCFYKKQLKKKEVFFLNLKRTPKKLQRWSIYDIVIGTEFKKTLWEFFFRIFVAFSEYMNFNLDM